jgi:hypothetical protein
MWTKFRGFESILNEPWRISLSALLCSMHSYSFHRIFVGFLMGARNTVCTQRMFLHFNRRNFFIHAGVGRQF